MSNYGDLRFVLTLFCLRFNGRLHGRSHKGDSRGIQMTPRLPADAVKEDFHGSVWVGGW